MLCQPLLGAGLWRPGAQKPNEHGFVEDSWDCGQTQNKNVHKNPSDRLMRNQRRKGVNQPQTDQPSTQGVRVRVLRVCACVAGHHHATMCRVDWHGVETRAFSEGKGMVRSTLASAIKWSFARTASAGGETRCEEGCKAVATGATRPADRSQRGQSRSNRDGEGWVRSS